MLGQKVSVRRGPAGDGPAEAAAASKGNGAMPRRRHPQVRCRHGSARGRQGGLRRWRGAAAGFLPARAGTIALWSAGAFPFGAGASRDDSLLLRHGVGVRLHGRLPHRFLGPGRGCVRAGNRGDGLRRRQPALRFRDSSGRQAHGGADRAQEGGAGQSRHPADRRAAHGFKDSLPRPARCEKGRGAQAVGDRRPPRAGPLGLAGGRPHFL